MPPRQRPLLRHEDEESVNEGDSITPPPSPPPSPPPPPPPFNMPDMAHKDNTKFIESD